MYTFKVLRVNDHAEWFNPDHALGASPDIEGSILKRGFTVEVSNGLVVLHTAELLANEPLTTESVSAVVESYKASLPERSSLEGSVF